MKELDIRTKSYLYGYLFDDFVGLFKSFDAYDGVDI